MVDGIHQPTMRTTIDSWKNTLQIHDGSLETFYQQFIVMFLFYLCGLNLHLGLFVQFTKLLLMTKK